MAREVTTTYISTWKKGNLITHIHSQKKNNSKTCKIWTSGYNPFPCFYMKSTYYVVKKWMEDNGFYQTIPCDREIRVVDDIDDETGEIMSHDRVIKTYIPVKQPTDTEEDIFILEDDEYCE